MRSQDPFLHPAVSKVIKAVWYEGSSCKPTLASRFSNRYQCSIEGSNEKEVPEAMVTVVATVVCIQILYLLSSCLRYCQIEAALTDCSNQSLGAFKVATYFIIIFYLMGFYCQITISDLIGVFKIATYPYLLVYLL